MSLFTDALSEFCAHHILEEKWLISPNLRAGFQLIDRIAKGGCGVLNMRVKTVRSLTLEIAAYILAGKKLSFATSLKKELLMGELFHALPAKESSLPGGKAGYLSKLKPGSGLFSLLLASIEQLKMAGITGSTGDTSGFPIRTDQFEEAAKGAEIILLFKAYEKALEEHKLLDYPSALHAAIREVLSGNFLFPESLFIIIPKEIIEYDLLPLEKKLINTIPEKNLIPLPAGQQAEKTGGGENSLSLLSMIHTPSKALFLQDEPLSRKNDGTVQFFRAQGEANEVREVFRRIVSQSIPFDQVEIVYTDPETYVPLLYETAFRFSADSDDSDDDRTVPVTFSDGIPIKYSNPGRALAGWISWISEDFSQFILARMIRDGLLDLDCDDTEGESNSGFAALLSKVKIGKGRTRYKNAFDFCIASLKKQLAAFPRADDESDPVKQKSELERKIRKYEVLRNFIDGLITHTPKPDDDKKKIAQDVLRFVETSIRSSGKFNNYSRKIIIEKIKELLDEYNSPAFVHFDIWDWLIGLIHNTHAYGLGPRPGCLYVTNIASGGYSGRPHTFVLGLDDSRFPGYRESDPILLEQERENISDELAWMTGTPEKKVLRLANFFGRLSGTCTLSYSSFDVKENREMFPSPVILSAFRIVTKNHEADLDTLAKALSPAAAFAPSIPGQAVSPDEWWLSRFCGKDLIRNSLDAVKIGYPFLKQGLMAKSMRMSHRFTVFDGYVPVLSEESDPYAENGLPLSANKLELLARSPLDFYFRYILRLPPAEPEKIDVNVWLDHKQRGSILHSVFRKFLAGITGKGELPSFSEHRELIRAILLGKLKEEEEKFCKRSAPAWFEVAVGMPQDQGETGISNPGTPLPEGLMLSNKKTIRVVARIDRIDRITTSDEFSFSVWDYKTGSTRNYDEKDPFRKGRNIQGILYLLVSEKRLSQIVSEKARVLNFGYFFTSLQGMGKRISWPFDVLLTGKEYLTIYADMIEAGCFPCPALEDDLLFSDYTLAMIDPELVRKQIILKMENPKNSSLDSFKRIRNE
jgi:hypothetical protein